MPIVTKTGDATAAAPANNRGVILAHIVNCKGAWGRGFVLALDNMSPMPKAAYKAWKSQCGTDDIPMGESLFVEVEPGKFVANMCAQKSLDADADGPCLIDYNALERCLKIIFLRALRLGCDVHMPAGMGSGLAGGNKAKIHALIDTVATNAERDSKFAKMVRECVNQNLEVNITLWEFEDEMASSYVPQDLGAAPSSDGDTGDPDAPLTTEPDEIANL